MSRLPAVIAEALKRNNFQGFDRKTLGQTPLKKNVLKIVVI
ncbi:hypothetical protein BOO71_0002380 [Deinococcus marmoris]|uniref:Uncharacterized protein n=1 Tax=Deinococcus marmoris TaxID=249408 RepID=A0A1U7P2Z1_9DEIO|nr:hypothetical protein BOO71_0002380 [Deinococcus marmoris]